MINSFGVSGATMLCCYFNYNVCIRVWNIIYIYMNYYYRITRVYILYGYERRCIFINCVYYYVVGVIAQAVLSRDRDNFNFVKTLQSRRPSGRASRDVQTKFYPTSIIMPPSAVLLAHMAPPKTGSQGLS